MSLDGVVLHAITSELSEKLVGGRVDKIHQPESDELLLQIRNKSENFKLLLSASSSNPRVHLTKSSKQNPQTPPAFCMLLRKHLGSGKVLGVEQPSLERVVIIKFESLDELGDLTQKDLIVEIMGKHSNIILVDSSKNKILDSIKRVPVSLSSVRQVLPGLPYSPPPAQEKRDPLDVELEDVLSVLNASDENLSTHKALYLKFVGLSPLLAREICHRSGVDSERLLVLLDHSEKRSLAEGFISFYRDVRLCAFYPNVVRDRDNLDVLYFSSVKLTQYGDYPFEHFESMSELLEYFFQSRDNRDRIKQKSSELRKSVSLKLERILNKVEKQRLEIAEAEKRESLRIKGDLLTANMHLINKGDSSVNVQNYYSESLDRIEIALDPRLSPSENAQRYYKKYNKLKTAHGLLAEQIEQSEVEIDYLQNIIYAIDNCTEVQEIDEIKEELVSEGYFKKSSLKNKKNSSAPSKPHEYISSDNYHMYVGKNNKQNDQLTMKSASKEDLWLHTKDIPGSHVIVKTNGDELPESTVLEAATLAAYYSKASQSSNVPVDYALRKNVKKPSGARPGMVIYENNSTVYVTPDKLSVSKIRKVEPS